MGLALHQRRKPALAATSIQNGQTANHGHSVSERCLDRKTETAHQMSLDLFTKIPTLVFLVSFDQPVKLRVAQALASPTPLRFFEVRGKIRPAEDLLTIKGYPDLAEVVWRTMVDRLKNLHPPAHRRCKILFDSHFEL